MNTTKDMRKLVSTLNFYRDAYYNQNTSLIPDKVYDLMYDDLARMEEEMGIVYADSPTRTVGYEVVSNLEKVRHNHPLLSLGKTTDITEFVDYFGKNPIFLMAKMDGLTASLTYKNGKLVLGESRGNGEIGENITHNVKVFSNIPLEIPFDGEVIVDGECIIDYDTFDEINNRESTSYKNPRNLVSGTVRQLDSKIAAARHVKFIAWKLYSVKNTDGSYHPSTLTYSNGFNFMESLGFETAPHVGVSLEFLSGTQRQTICQEMIDVLKSKANDLEYPIDGIVGAFDDVAFGNSLGSTSHHPKHSLAYKFYQEDNETTLLDIEWNTSRTGLVNPVAIFEPVEIDGTTVSRATLNNVSIIKELELGIGDTLTVIKANQIIPQITGNLTRSNTYQIPTKCPSCGSHLVMRNESGRAALYCINEDCPAVNQDKISHFASREGMNIIGISDERLKILMNKGFVTDYASLYDLKNHREIEFLEGFGKSSVDNLIDAIDKSRYCKFSNLLVALSIPYIGKSTAKSVAKYCDAHKGDKKIFDYFLLLAANDHDWTHLENFGSSMSLGINEYVQKNMAKISPLVSILDVAEDNSENKSENKFGGQAFCITGKLYKYENRDKLIEDIEKYGGKVVSDVTSKTNYLITNDTESGSSKNQKAAKFGTKIISEDDFIKLCE